MDKIEFVRLFFNRIPFGHSIYESLYLFYSYVRNLSRQVEVEHPFGIFQIELTNHCPMKCIMCPRTYGMTRKLGFMSFDLYRKCIDELIRVNHSYEKNERIWLHHFGESLLHPQFDKFIKYASDRGLKPCLSLNPYVLNEENALKLIEVNPYLLYISLDGHDDASFYRIRGVRNAYEVSKENLLRFLELKTEYKSRTAVHLSMIDFIENEKSINLMRDYWKRQKGIDKFFVKSYETFGGGVEVINSFSKKRGNEKRTQVICYKPWQHVTIAWDGKAVPCCFDYNCDYVLGDVNKKTILEIWNEAPMKDLRREFINNNVRNSLCKNCELLYSPPKL